MIGSENMLIMKIITNDEYYYVEKENNQYSVLCINNEKDYYLNSQEWNNLVEEMLGGEKKYLERKDGYDIYIDSMNNKRYFRDGIEDIEKLFNVNSTSALLFQEETNNGEENNSKKIILNSKKKKYIITYISTYMMLIIMMLSGKKAYLLSKEKSVEPITLSQMQDYIEECETYEEYQKQILANMDFLEDVYSIADEKTRKELALTYKKLGIEYFSEQEKQNRPDTAGYVRSTDRGMIHLRDKNKQRFYDTGPHEFVHVNQQNMIYKYVDEAVAEIVIEEYYNNYVTIYYEARNNISILMEIIGPEPIMRLSFNNEIETFEKIIKSYLDKKDANKLLNEFKLKATKIEYKGSILKEANHELIREMLGKMYEKKYPGKKMEDDPVIYQILNNNEQFKHNRYYFNQRSEKFYASKDMFLTTKKIYDKNIEKSISLIFYKKILNITKEEVIFIIENNKLKDDDTFIVIYYEDELGENKSLTINKYSDENEINNAIELLNNSDIKLTDIEKITNVEQRPSEENTIPTIFRENKALQSVNILFNNEAIGSALLDDNGNIYIIKSELKYITSVAEKFPNQIKQKKQLFNNVLDYYMIKDIQTYGKEKEMKSNLLNEDYPLLLIDNAFYKINQIEKTAICTYDFGIEDMRWISVLMEIIGPSPIKEYYYSKNSTIIKNAINEYLDSDEVDELLSEFQKAPEEADYEKIKKLIAKLYENVNLGHKMEEDPAIFGLVNDYHAICWNRHYFNDSSLDKTNIDIEQEIPYDNNFENNLSDITITYTLEEINSEEETINSLNTDSLNDDEYIIIYYEDLEYYNYEEQVITKNTDKNIINNFIEKIRNGEITFFSAKKNKKISLPLKPGIIKEKLLNEQMLYINITVKYKDGYTGYVDIDDQGKIRPIKIVPIILQTIQEKFSEQNEYSNKR